LWWLIAVFAHLTLFAGGYFRSGRAGGLFVFVADDDDDDDDDDHVDDDDVVVVDDDDDDDDDDDERLSGSLMIFFKILLIVFMFAIAWCAQAVWQSNSRVRYQVKAITESAMRGHIFVHFVLLLTCVHAPIYRTLNPIYIFTSSSTLSQAILISTPA
jgi:hypothetical protein